MELIEDKLKQVEPAPIITEVGKDIHTTLKEQEKAITR